MIGIGVLEIFRLLLMIINYCMQLPSFFFALFFWITKIKIAVQFSRWSKRKRPSPWLVSAFVKILFSCFFLFAQMRGLFGNAGPYIGECSFFFLVCATLSTSKSTTLLRLKKQERLCKVTSKASTNSWTSPWFYCISFLTLPADSSLICPTGSQNTLLW